MYEAHFGLKHRPFGSKADGVGVFVGPHQTNTMTSLRKGLAAADAIVTVTGPFGVGKTTIVSRALESISPNRMVAWVGRMQLSPDEVLELLLAGFGVNRQAKGSLQRFAAFRRLLNERAATGAQVAIVVEDAMRIGVAALIELEALTAADTGDTGSANIILMGPPELNELLTTPELARIRQRNRLRQTIDPLSAAEVNGYMKHCLREAGGDSDAIFEDGVTDILYRCSEGIPRIINTLCETALSTAAESGAQQVSVALMRQVAADAFGFEPDLIVVTPSVELPKVETAPIVQPTVPAARPEPIVKTEFQAPAPEVVVESGQYPDMAPDADAGSSAKEALPASSRDIESNDIPELINDTNHDLKQLDAEPLASDASAEFDIESTQTQKRPAMFANDDAVDNEEDEPDFDLDQALSPETDSTNLMPGLTPNLDQLAAQSRMQDLKNKSPVQEDTADVPRAPTENLPTLSDSMRVDVEVEVERAKRIDDVQTANAPVVAEPVAVPDIKPEPEPESKPVPEIASAPEPEPEPEPLPEIASAPDSEPEPEPLPEIASAPEPEPEPEPVPEIASAPEPEPEPEPLPEIASAPEPEPEPEPLPEIASAPAPEPEPVPETAPTPLSVSEPKQAKVSAPKTSVAAVSAPEPEAEAEPEIKTESAEQPEADPESPIELSLETEPEPVAKTDAAPELPAKGKKAKRIPDIGALEAALDSAKRGDFAAQPGNEPIANLKTDEKIKAADQLPESKDEPATDIPEITLDDELPQQKPSDLNLEKCALEIGSANSLEDISDFAAETIFGNEAFDEIAAAVTANPPVEEPSPVMLQESEIAAAANGMIDAKQVADPVPQEAAAPADMDASAKNRLAMVNALNNGVPTVSTPQSETIELGEDKPKSIRKKAKLNGPQPEPIENQINTSMTQTLKALSAAKATQPKSVEEDEKPSGGLFSRFRRSS